MLWNQCLESVIFFSLCPRLFWHPANYFFTWWLQPDLSFKNSPLWNSFIFFHPAFQMNVESQERWKSVNFHWFQWTITGLHQLNIWLSVLMKFQLQVVAGKKPDTIMETYNEPVKVLCLQCLIFANVSHCIMAIKTRTGNNHLTCLLTLGVSLRCIEEFRMLHCLSIYHFPELFPLFPAPFYNFHLCNDILGDPPLHF